jgi:hypothetical protein
MNGCETDLSKVANSCATSDDVGAGCGDINCGSVISCSNATWGTLATRNGKGSKWFKAHANECAGCCADVEAHIELVVPPGVNYDLHAYAACGQLIASSANPTGQTESFVLFLEDDCLGGDSGFDYWIEVRYVAGSSCQDWKLTFQKSSC